MPKIPQIFDPIQFDQAHIWHPYSPSPSHYPQHLITSANGVWLTLNNGQKVIDGMSSWWAMIHGHNHPELNKAIKQQVDVMAHVMFGGLTHTPAIALAKKLVEITPKPLTQVFFSDSGSVSVEVAIKMALQYQIASNKPNKSKLITVRGGYHGDTIGAMAVCDPQQGMHHLFQAILTQHYFVKQPNEPGAIEDLEKTLKAQHSHIAAMILEPIVQGAGGMVFYSSDYLIKARQLCTQYEVLLIIDEIATGFGRTGALFASSHIGVEADILCLGKALTGGYLSLGATLTTQKIANKIGTLMHGPTFMANPLACSVALKSIEILLNSCWQANIKQIEQTFIRDLSLLKNHSSVADVRVLGAIAVVEMVDNIEVESVQNKLIKQGVWLRPFGKLLYSMPSFNITADELHKLTHAIKTIVCERPLHKYK